MNHSYTDTSIGHETRSTKAKSALTIVLAWMFLIGTFQNAILASFPSFEAVTLVDDALLALGVLFALPRLSNRGLMPVLAIGAFGLIILLAALRSSVGQAITFELTRSVAVPALLVLIGLALTRPEFVRLSKVWLILSVITSLYIFLEMSGIRLFNPTVYSTITDPNGALFGDAQLPGSFYYWNPDGSASLRAGGIALNPPIAGTLIGIGAVICFHLVKRLGLRVLLFVVQIAALAFTQGRGGMVIVIIGTLLPWVVRKMGLALGIGVILPIGLYGFQYFSAAGDSVSHMDGLIHGVTSAIQNPLGEGFGSVGNIVKQNLRTEDASESLVGVALTAGGLPVMLLVAILLITLLRRMRRRDFDWTQYLGLGALSSAMLSESSGALAGASFMWIALGVAVAALPAARQFHPTSQTS